MITAPLPRANNDNSSVLWINYYIYQLVKNLLELHSPCSKLQLPVSVVI